MGGGGGRGSRDDDAGTGQHLGNPPWISKYNMISFFEEAPKGPLHSLGSPPNFQTGLGL